MCWSPESSEWHAALHNEQSPIAPFQLSRLWPRTWTGFRTFTLEVFRDRYLDMPIVMHTLITRVNRLFEPLRLKVELVEVAPVTLPPLEPGVDRDVQLLEFAYDLRNESIYEQPNASLLVVSGPTRRWGLAWNSSLGTPGAVAWIRPQKGRDIDHILMAHEIGHILGCGHDGAQGSKCVSPGHIMWPVIYPEHTTWSSCSDKRIRWFTSRVDCLKYEGLASKVWGPTR